MLIEAKHPKIPVRRQCELLGLSPSTLYARPPHPSRGESAFNERLMRLIDEQYLRTPFYGVERMTRWLNRHLADEGRAVNVKRVRRLMRRMGIEAVYPRPRTSVKHPDHTVYPYLLTDVTIDRPDQVWCTDITYIRLRRGWVYLTAVMDWFSRYVLSWEVSITMDASFCVEALEGALDFGTPEIFNSDQGSQFTSRAFTSVLLGAGIQISMDGRGRVYDNIFIERLWRSVKYEEVYLHDYETVAEAVSGLRRYFAFYNDERLHQALDYQTPAEVYGVAGCSPSGWTGIENQLNRKGDDRATWFAAAPVALRAPCAAANEPHESTLTHPLARPLDGE
jgi:putative transposase